LAERIAQANGIEIAYETFGDPEAPTVLLVMGLATQMIAWDEEFCRQLAERGFHVVRFDNRDVGHSTKIRGGPRPRIWAAMLGLDGRPSYGLEDMADDAVGLLDHLDVGAAHVVGASMGGMIAQTIAIRHPDRVRSLCSIMSTTGKRRVNLPRLRAFAGLVRRAPREREAYVEYIVRMFRVIGGPGFPGNEERIRELAGASYDRCHYPPGVARQLVAIMASGDRTAALGRIRVPTVVIHGTDDPLIRLRAGKATARAIPGAELITIPGMGHDLPPEIWPALVDAIEAVAARAESGEDVLQAAPGGPPRR
jgi:pimeloyl-ACP methyl ester carboxylesterase